MHAPRAAQPFVRSKEGSSSSKDIGLVVPRRMISLRRHDALLAGGAASRKFGGSALFAYIRRGTETSEAVSYGGEGVKCS